MNNSKATLKIETNQQSIVVEIGGAWVLSNYQNLSDLIEKNKEISQYKKDIVLNAKNVSALDTVGALFLHNLFGQQSKKILINQDTGLSLERQKLLESVSNSVDSTPQVLDRAKTSAISDFLNDIGLGLTNFFHQFIGLLGFAGLCLQGLLINVVRPKTWRITSIVAQVQQTGLHAVPIIALLTFLVGAVVAYLGATILKDFGATIFTVNLVGFSFLREFAVLLTAILMAGRTASAFTAQIGSMKVNEEIDAIRVQGLSPMELLVLPRIIAMQISMPILTFVGMISGIFGGMLVCYFSLDITPNRFLILFSESIPIRHFYLGMAKAPIFAFLIATIGCQQGFKVSGSAESVGEHTTSSVVHSIFVVILIDALAAMFFMEMGW